MDRGGIPIGGAGARENGLRPLFRSMNIAASGLSAYRARIDAIAGNIANAETTRTADGTPYRRKMVQLEEIPFSEVMAGRQVEGAFGGMEGVRSPFEMGNGVDAAAELDTGGVRVLGTVEDTSPGPMVYDPGHPDANDDGYVQMSNVRVTDELVNLMEARRLYEANASVFDAVKSMLFRATQL